MRTRSTQPPVATVPCTVLVAVVAILAWPSRGWGDVKLPSVISDGMVLQRHDEVPIFGWASPGETVRVEPSWGFTTAEVEADERGRWRVGMPTYEAGGPHTLKVSGTTTIEVRDVWIGEVWLCSGQSNMEWPVRAAQDADAALARADDPQLKLFDVPNQFSLHPRAECGGRWLASSEETAAGFSAVAWAFGRRLREALGVPVGLIESDWGGTVVEAWMSERALRQFPALAPRLDELAVLRDPNRRGRVAESGRGRWWRDLGAPDGAGRWAHADFDAASWETYELPATFGGERLGNFDGVVYFRRILELDAERAGRDAVLELGPIDDYDDAWVNGEHVGATHEPGSWATARRYEVPARVLRSGTNVIAVRVLDTGGPGGINGRRDQLRLRFGEEAISLAGPWAYEVGRPAAELPAMPSGAAVDQNAPGALCNAMIHPLEPFRLRGVIWYQGESNWMRPEEYGPRFRALIEDWRKRFERDDLAIIFVQIAPFRYGGDRGQVAALREAQASALALPDTAMVVTLDVGDPADIHPRDKRTVGERLAACALARAYGRRSVPHTGPQLASWQVEDGAVRLRFRGADSGLELRPVPRSPFWIAGEDGRFVRAQAWIEGGDVVVRSDAVPQPTVVRYAWEAVPQPALFDAGGLPAAPFRTDPGPAEIPPPANDDEMSVYRSEPTGFVDLFNGRDLSGWRNVNCAPSTWQVRDGVIHCTGVPTGVLRTEGVYQNYVLELEYRHLRTGGNAGLFVWSDPLTARGQPFTRSLEVQVMDGREGPGFTSDGDIFPIHGASMTPENGRGGQRAFPTERRANPSPLWNHYRVRCVDGDIELAVNGTVVTRGHDATPRSGYICLESEGSPVEFRNIRIRVLPGPELLPAQCAARDEGFISLYDGVGFSGWRFGEEHRGHWRAADWRIDFDGQGSDLWSERSYGDFELICDWRWSSDPRPVARPVILADGSVERDAAGAEVTVEVPDAGDSGIYLRGSSKSQVNIWCWPIGSGEVYGYRTDASMPPEVRAAVTPSKAADAPIGSWNRFHITMRGEELTVLLNGDKVIDRARLPGVPAEGPIALQKHGGAIQFANIYIREL